MAIEMNTRDVLEIAQQLEHHGQEFYSHAAEHADDRATRQLYLELAAMEGEHEQVFAGLKSQLGGDQAETTKHSTAEWNIVAKTFLNGLEGDLFKRFEGKEDRLEILREAMAFEKDTIALFLALRNTLPLEPDRRRVDDLLKEELGHLLKLGCELARRDSTPTSRASLFGEANVTQA